jgi:hypothetical protein
MRRPANKPSRRARGRHPGPAAPRSAAARLEAAEALFRDFARLTPYPYEPFTRTFDSFDEYQQWRRAQRNPWYR